MKKLYGKNELTFSILWIVIYCVVSGTVRKNFGDESPWLLLVNLLIAAAGLAFVKRNRFEGTFGLSGWPAAPKCFLYFIPVWVLVTGNLWGGIHPHFSGTALVCAVLSMMLVGFIEELIFRGFLFRALLKENKERTAVIISALTFGIGHIVNLLLGQGGAETIIQILFAIAWGFIFTLVYLKSGSLLPGILAHSLIDVFSVFSADLMTAAHIYAFVTIAVSLFYCLYLSRLESAVRR